MLGVIDCCFAEGDEFYIIDYKTDYVNQNTAAERASEYAPQIRAYAMAVSRMTGRPVAGAALYFLRSGCTAELSAGGEELQIHWNK